MNVTKFISIGVCGVALAGCASHVATSGGEIATVTPANNRELPRGSVLEVRMNRSVGTRDRIGDEFTATVTRPLIATNGQTVVPEGAMVYGHITGLHAGSVNESSEIRLDFDKLAMRGRDFRFDADISNVKVKSEVNDENLARNAVTGAVVGAALGGILGGAEVSHLVAGGLLGAAAGTVVSLGTGPIEHTIPDGSDMTLVASRTINLR